MRCNYKNIWVERIQIIKIKLYEYLSIRYKFLPKLWNKNNTKGIDIKPENETALAITKYSFTNKFWFLRSNWKNTKNNNDTNITDTMLVRRFLNDLFSM